MQATIIKIIVAFQWSKNMSILVSIALATICFTSQGQYECYPVLLGKNTPTPTGEFTLIRRYVLDPGYGGDVLQFSETKTTVFAIHRVWLLNPKQHRLERLKSNNVTDRFISNGCINVDPIVYEKLVDCCSNDKLTIE
jgi:hypothetical protein